MVVLYKGVRLSRWHGSKDSLPIRETQETRVRFLGQEDLIEKEWQPTPVFLPGKFHGQKNLVGYSPWVHKESDTTDHTHAYTHTHTHTPPYKDVKSIYTTVLYEINEEDGKLRTLRKERENTAFKGKCSK